MYVSFSCDQEQLNEIKQKLNNNKEVEIKGMGLDDICELEATLWLVNIDDENKIGDEYFIGGEADLVTYDDGFEYCNDIEYELI